MVGKRSAVLNPISEVKPMVQRSIVYISFPWQEKDTVQYLGKIEFPFDKKRYEENGSPRPVTWKPSCTKFTITDSDVESDSTLANSIVDCFIISTADSDTATSLDTKVREGIRGKFSDLEGTSLSLLFDQKCFPEDVDMPDSFEVSLQLEIEHTLVYDESEKELETTSTQFIIELEVDGYHSIDKKSHAKSTSVSKFTLSHIDDRSNLELRLRSGHLLFGFFEVTLDGYKAGDEIKGYISTDEERLVYLGVYPGENGVYVPYDPLDQNFWCNSFTINVQHGKGKYRVGVYLDHDRGKKVLHELEETSKQLSFKYGVLDGDNEHSYALNLTREVQGEFNLSPSDQMELGGPGKYKKRSPIYIKRTDVNEVINLDSFNLSASSFENKSEALIVRVKKADLFVGAGDMTEYLNFRSDYNLENYGADEISEVPFFLIQDEADYALRVGLSEATALINEAEQDAFEIEVQIQFEVYEVDAGKAYDWRRDNLRWGNIDLDRLSLRQEVELEMSFPLVIQYPERHICIDLGTSAIAMTEVNTSVSSSENTSVINLQKQLRTLLGSDYDADRKQETGTPFISSTILRQPGKEYLASEYQNSFLIIAPDVSEIYNNQKNILPSLKLLFNWQRGRIASLGRVVQYLDDEGRRYQIVDQEKIIKTLVRLLVGTLAYYFIDANKDDSPAAGFSKLFLTITTPNGFGGQYREIFKKEIARVLLKKAMPIEKINLITESDAACFSYLSNWGAFNQANLARKNKIENIVTYDIGAGTVDISFIQRTTKGIEDSRYEFRVVGRIGAPIAGNYLDYVLSQIILDIVSGKNVLRVNKTTPNKEMGDYHQWVRNYLKPQLAPYSLGVTKNTHISARDAENSYNKLFVDEDFTLDVYDIFNHARYRDYLLEIGDSLFAKLIKLFWGAENKVEISTILFSGRGSLMTSVREHVEGVIKRNAKNTNTVVIDYQDWCRVTKRNEPEAMKAMVSLGALDYATHYSKRYGLGGEVRISEPQLLFKYGLLIDDQDGKRDALRFFSLIRPGENFLRGRNVLTGIKVSIKLGSTKNMYLVQTVEPDDHNFSNDIDKGVFKSAYTSQIAKINRYPVFNDYKSIAARVLIKKDRFLLIEFYEDVPAGRIIHQERIENYRVGYNTDSVQLQRSLWPFVPTDDQNKI